MAACSRSSGFRCSALAVGYLKKGGLQAVAAVCFLDFVGSSEHSKSAGAAGPEDAGRDPTACC